MFNQKGRIKWKLVAVIAIVVAVVGIVFYSMFKQNDYGGGDFSGWKTYKNSEYGFELKYPAELAGKENTADPGDGTQGGIGFTIFKSAAPNDTKAEAMVFGADKFVANPDKSATSTMLIKDGCKVLDSYRTDKNIKLADKQISGANFTRIETGQEGKAQGDLTTHYIGYVGQVSGVCYRFFLFYAKDDNLTKQADIDLFEKIISTVTLKLP
jgi:hypothetical protein